MRNADVSIDDRAKESEYAAKESEYAFQISMRYGGDILTDLAGHKLLCSLPHPADCILLSGWKYVFSCFSIIFLCCFLYFLGNAGNMPSKKGFALDGRGAVAVSGVFGADILGTEGPVSQLVGRCLFSFSPLCESTYDRRRRRGTRFRE